jgi:hypothetical protein
VIPERSAALLTSGSTGGDMPKSTKPRKSESAIEKTAKEMRSKGSSVGAIARHLNLPMEVARCLIWGKGYEERLQRLPTTLITSQEPTEQLFVQWLSEAAHRLSALPTWPLGAGQFTYFDSEACWQPARILSTVDLRDLGDEAAYMAGEEEAIFHFAKGNRDALRHIWVIEQLEAWRCEGTKDSKRKLRRFISAYSDDGVKRMPQNILENIKRDQDIYRDSLSDSFRNGQQRLVSALSDKYMLGENGIKDILKHYHKAYDRWRLSKRARLYCQGLFRT